MSYLSLVIVRNASQLSSFSFLELFCHTMQHLGKAALRVTKNYTKGYSETQAKVRDATSNDPWGPSGTQMNEIAQLTYNQLRFYHPGGVTVALS